jgi:hypothetical protein
MAARLLYKRAQRSKHLEDFGTNRRWDKEVCTIKHKGEDEREDGEESCEGERRRHF